MARVMVEVPENHTIQIHPPGLLQPGTGGQVPDPAHAGALAAMNAALPSPGEQTKKPPAPEQPARKKKTPEKQDGKTNERQMGGGGKEKTPR
jgi:hypothetical protein